MITLETKAAMRNNYLETVGSQLAELGAEIVRFHHESRQIKPTARYLFYHNLQIVEDQYKAVQKDFQNLSLSGPDNWVALQTQIDQSFSRLQLVIQKMRKITGELKQDSSSWAKGLAADEVVDTAGWAEGQASEDPVTSMGWAEGQASEDIVESIGWAEGQAKNTAA